MITPQRRNGNPYVSLLLICFLLAVSIYFGFAIYHKVNSSGTLVFEEQSVLTGEPNQFGTLMSGDEAESTDQPHQSDIARSVKPSKQDVSSMGAQPPEKKSSELLSIPVISQYPELYNGCEVTSLAMLLQYYGSDASKLDLAKAVKKDETKMQLDANGKISIWGNPNTGFVGDVTGNQKGLGVYHEPLFDLLQMYVPSAVDLTGEDFETIERQISEQIPVVVWTTVNFTVPDSWLTWNSPTGQVTSTFLEHAVLLVGYNEDNVYINDPLSETQKMKIDKQQFMDTWVAMGKQAISYKNSEEGEQDGVSESFE